MPSKQNSSADHNTTPGFLARHPAVGWIVLIVSTIIFCFLVFNVKTNGPALQWDQPIDQSLHARAIQDIPFNVEVMRFTAQIGQNIAAGIITLLAFYWFFKKYWYNLAMLLIGVSGGTLWFLLLSNLIGRHRPIWPDPLETLPGPGFPSGHSITATLLYGLLLYLILQRLTSNAWRLIAVIDAIGLILLIGYSRLYIGSHFPTDVLGGYSFGLAWGSLVFTAVELLRHRNSVQHHKAIRMPAESESIRN
jgi:undecaprenyl-diphosphatase